MGRPKHSRYCLSTFSPPRTTTLHFTNTSALTMSSLVGFCLVCRKSSAGRCWQVSRKWEKGCELAISWLRAISVASRSSISLLLRLTAVSRVATSPQSAPHPILSQYINKPITLPSPSLHITLFLFIQTMSLAAQFENFRDNARVVFNDRFIGDEGAKELARFIAEHRRVEVLEIKSNDISAEGFKEVFEALTRNSSIRQLIVEYNNLGESQYDDWEDKLVGLIEVSPKFERLNISNNKIGSEAFKRLVPALAASKSLKLLELRYNSINSADVDYLTGQLKRAKNESLLYVELSGNKIKKESVDALQAILKVNRSKNPISKDKLLMTGGVFTEPAERNDRSSNVGTFYMNKTNAIDDLSRENVVRHLEEILDQNRKDTAEMKVRLEKELQDLIRREKNDARDLQELQNKCNELVIQNRNLKFEVDRTTSEHQQMERDQELHLRVHEEKLREANKEIQELEQKYEEIEERMQKEHDMKMKEIAREWEGRLRSLEEKIRTVENENNQVENEIKKGLEKRERVRVEYLEEENQVKNRIEEEEAQRYGLKLSALQAKLREIEQTREKLIRRNQDLLYEIEKTEGNSIKQNTGLQQEINDLKLKEEQFTIRNKQFLTKNEKLKSEIQLKEITIEKLEEQLNRLNEEIDLKKKYNKDQVDKIILDNTDIRRQKEQEKRLQIEKLNELQTSLRNAQLQNAKLRQEYGVLAQKLHVNLGRAIQDVFSENNLF